jgi:putative oxidoreductase
MHTTKGIDLGLLMLRLGVGLFMLIGHGWGKLIGFPQLLDRFPDPIGLGPGLSLVLAVFAEVVCSVLLVLGLGTRLAAVPLLITMVVAAFIIHADDPWVKQELALMYAIPYFSLIFTGAGRFSLDELIANRRA